MSLNDKTVQELHRLTQLYLRTGLFLLPSWADRRFGRVEALHDKFYAPVPLLRTAILRSHFRALAKELKRPFLWAIAGNAYTYHPGGGKEGFIAYCVVPRRRYLDPVVAPLLLVAREVPHYTSTDTPCFVRPPHAPYQRPDGTMMQPVPTVYEFTFQGPEGKQLFDGWRKRLHTDPTCRAALRLDQPWEKSLCA